MSLCINFGFSLFPVNTARTDKYNVLTSIDKTFSPEEIIRENWRLLLTLTTSTSVLYKILYVSTGASDSMKNNYVQSRPTDNRKTEIVGVCPKATTINVDSGCRLSCPA